VDLKEGQGIPHVLPDSVLPIWLRTWKTSPRNLKLRLTTPVIQAIPALPMIPAKAAVKFTIRD
jgi:hypothetical protein